jgi:hypothetical protein
MSSYAEDFEVLVTSIISISCIWIETVQNNTMMWIVARKQDYFLFPIVYFPFICSNIPKFVSGPVFN